MNPSAASPSSAEATPGPRHEQRFVLHVEALRGSAVESRHLVVGAWIGALATALPAAPEPLPLTAFFIRSAAKPFQLLPLVAQGGAASFDDIDLALMASSHDGTPEQAERVRSILARFGFDEAALRCGAHRPYFLDRRPPDDPARLRTYGPLHHNCSGHHAAMLAHAKLLGIGPKDYLDPANVAQQQILNVIEAFAGATPEVTMDNCGSPCYRLAAPQVAALYGYLATPRRLAMLTGVRRQRLEAVAPLADWEAALERIATAMSRYPDWLTGRDNPVTQLAACAPGELVVKHGAEGVLCLAHRGRDAALALKVVDGNPRAVTPAAACAMQALGWWQPAQDELRRRLETVELFGYTHEKTGLLRASIGVPPDRAVP